MTLSDPARFHQRPKLLLVDDRPDNLVALQAILQSLDLEMISAGSGEQALKQLLTHDIAVILLDVQMPGMDGFETAAHIKRRERTRHIPIIFLTAIDREPAHAFRGYSAGAVDYLAKPFDPWVLRAKVSVLVDLYEKSRLVTEQAEQLRERVNPQHIALRLEAIAAEAEAGTSPQEIAQQLRTAATTLRATPVLQDP
jgi:CheY-like chemotaxis protein